MKLFKLISLFFFPCVLGTLAAGYGAYQGINTLMGKGQEKPNFYTPQYQGMADQNFGQMLPQLSQYSQGQAQGVLAPQQQMYGAGQQAYQTGFDPQMALYHQLYQQQQNQSGAANSMYGLGASGQGAALANQNAQNFDINWQNNQQQRQLQGLQGMNQANQGATALGQYGMNALQMPMNQDLSYLGYGGAQNANQFKAQNAADTFNAAQQGGAMQGLMGAIGGSGTQAAGAAGAGAVGNQGYLNQLSGSGLSSYLTSMFSGGGGGVEQMPAWVQ